MHFLLILFFRFVQLAFALLRRIAETFQFSFWDSRVRCGWGADDPSGYLSILFLRFSGSLREFDRDIISNLSILFLRFGWNEAEYSGSVRHLSILFLRFRTAPWTPATASRRTLSILFLRFSHIRLCGWSRRFHLSILFLRFNLQE